jgi:hypothetical protein
MFRFQHDVLDPAYIFAVGLVLAFGNAAVESNQLLGFRVETAELLIIEVDSAPHSFKALVATRTSFVERPKRLTDFVIT